MNVDVTRFVMVTVRVTVVVFFAEAPAVVRLGFCDEADADIDIALITRIAHSNVRGKTWPFSNFRITLSR